MVVAVVAVVVAAANVVVITHPQEAGQKTSANADAHASATSAGKRDVGHNALFVRPSGHVFKTVVLVVVVVVVVMVAIVVVSVVAGVVVDV